MHNAKKRPPGGHLRLAAAMCSRVSANGVCDCESDVPGRVRSRGHKNRANSAVGSDGPEAAPGRMGAA